MAEIITMPLLSDTMTEGVVAQWHKKVGDLIEEGDILADIETDKATMEFESFYDGTLLYIGVPEGEAAPVDSLLAIIGGKDDNVDELIKNFKGKTALPTPTTEKTEEVKQEIAETTPTESTGSQRVFASPLAKKIASEKGLDLATVTGSGDHGRIVKKDVESFISPATAPETEKPISLQTAPVLHFVAAGEESAEEIKNSQMRKTIARRLGESKFTAPHFYLTIEVTMDNAITARKAINEMPDTKVSFNDMVVKATAMALQKHPRVNSQWLGDSTRIYHHIHMGVAVSVDDGLVVPVVKFANQKSLTQLGAEIKDLAIRSRSKKIQPKEMEGSTFTVSNLGMFGISEFTSIINQPNSAILSVGAIIQKPIVKNGEIVVGNTMKFTLACDHRTVDGVTGSQFLATLKQYIENPVTMLA